MRVVCISLLIFMLTITTSGCSYFRNSKETHPTVEASPVKVTLWAQETFDPRQTSLQESIRKFNETNKAIQIVPYYYETETYKNKLRVAIVSGKMPDVFYFWTGDNFKQMVNSGVVADLNGMLGTHADYRSQFARDALEATTYNGHVYGIPYAVRHVLIWYNKRIFQENGLSIPTTWDQMMDMVGVLSGKGITPFAAAGKERWPLLHWFAYLSNRIGGEEPMERVLKRESNFTDPSFVEAGVLFHELIKRKAFPASYLGIDTLEAEKLFLSGKTAMYMQGDWAAGKLLGYNDYGREMGYFPFPEVNGRGDRTHYYGGYSSGWAISASSNISSAFEVLSYLTSRNENKGLTESSGAVSPIKDLDISEAETPRGLYDYIKYIRNDPSGYFGFYDQVTDQPRAQQLLDAVMTFAGEEEMSRQEIEAVLAKIR